MRGVLPSVPSAGFAAVIDGRFLSQPRLDHRPGEARDADTADVQYSTVQYSTVQYSTVQYSTVHYSLFALFAFCRNSNG